MRKVVSVSAVNEECFHAACNDGSVWTVTGNVWARKSDVPQDAAEPDCILTKEESDLIESAARDLGDNDAVAGVALESADAIKVILGEAVEAEDDA